MTVAERKIEELDKRLTRVEEALDLNSPLADAIAGARVTGESEPGTEATGEPEPGTEATGEPVAGETPETEG